VEDHLNEQPTSQPDPEFVGRVQATFSRQAFMSTLGAELVRVEMGKVETSLPFRGDLNPPGIPKRLLR
jgi:acyl-coenzyme A thioesterase PaaI-like protein